MDNASKALIMAGGVLITVMIISISLYVLTSARGVASASEDRIVASQIEAFNRFFINYDSTITGLDVYNIIGKIDDINNDASSIVSALDYHGPSKSDVTETEKFDDTFSYSYTIGSNGAVQSITIY